MNRIAFLFLLVSFLFSCTMPNDAKNENMEQDFVIVINWNLQTFFDAITVGTEYNDFKGSKTRWDENRYKDRIKTLCSFIEQTQADIYVFQEIENSGILQDISNELVSLKKIEKDYAYSAFSKNDGDALGIAFFSQFPLKNVSVHQLDIQTAHGLSAFETSKNIVDGTVLEQPSMRAILHAQIVTDKNKPFSIYACHWKSKFGGEEESEVWRNAQEMLLANLLLEEKNPYLVTGDFNRTLEEFLLKGTTSTEKPETLMLQSNKDMVQVRSAWLEYSSKENQGSYYYQGEWEKIDHIFYSPTLSLLDYKVIKNSITTTQEGIPYRYDLYSGKGTSDHLPLHCIVDL